MSTYDVKLPDVGEGVAEAELITWLVEVGDRVTSDSVLAEVMTDKATVEVACPVSGVVVALHGEPGDVLAVGGGLVSIELDGAAPAPRAPATPSAQIAAVASVQAASAGTPRVRTLAAPAVRSRAASLGIDLATVAGTGPDGRVVHADLDRVLLGRGGSAATAVVASGADEPHVEPVRGLRRRIAERLTSAWTQIPHITYVDAIDVTDLEILRTELNRRSEPTGTRLTILPFLARAIVLAAADQPRLNATYDAAAQTLSVFDAVHLGIATQTDDGLIVPVVRHAEARGLWDLAAEIGRVASAARAGSATRQELSGSTITITSLGALGGLVTTPIINQPEVAIIGVNKLETRPVWRNGSFEPRQMMNLSSSFDHRIVDGWDAATFIQRIKAVLELPALLFVDGDPSAPLGR
jgi:2-oxoisovalerate dehydrogenase E2 component (dihydrolipoyl transacylase)